MASIQNTQFFNLNIPKINFKANAGVQSPVYSPRKDSFNANPLYQNLDSEIAIESAAKANPRLMNTLKENKIPLKVNMAELENLKRGHLLDTRVVAAKMYSALPVELKQEVNLMDLQQAAMLHDFGKVLIPKEILNKSGKLNEKEKEIMSLHSELGYELLKSQGVNQNVLDLVRYHHQNPQGTGYPAVKDGFEYGVSSQILATADKYSALREERSYKDAMTKEDALAILRQDVEKGLISNDVYVALEKVV